MTRCTGQTPPPDGPRPTQRPPRGADATLARHVTDCLAPLGGLRVERTGAVYKLLSQEPGTGVPIGIVHRGAVYFKVGPESVTRYIAAGMRPFRPSPRQSLRGYWRVPQDVLADPHALRVWARAAIDSALRFGGRRRAPSGPADLDSRHRDI